MTYQDFPSFPFTGGSVVIAEPGFYSNAGISALNVTIANPDAATWVENIIAFCFKNRSTANVTFTPPSGKQFLINQAAAATFILRPGSSAFIYTDGFYWYGMFSEDVATVQRFTPLTGTTLTVVQTTSPIINYIIVPAGTIAALTIPFPSSPFDGQIVNIVSRQSITSVTLSGGTVFGGVATLAANVPVRYVYVAADVGWQII